MLRVRTDKLISSVGGDLKNNITLLNWREMN